MWWMVKNQNGWNTQFNKNKIMEEGGTVICSYKMSNCHWSQNVSLLSQQISHHKNLRYFASLVTRRTTWTWVLYHIAEITSLTRRKSMAWERYFTIHSRVCCDIDFSFGLRISLGSKQFWGDFINSLQNLCRHQEEPTKKLPPEKNCKDNQSSDVKCEVWRVSISLNKSWWAASFH